MKRSTLWILSGVALLASGTVLASPKEPGLDLISCLSSTDERLAECGVRGFMIADPDALELTLTRHHYELIGATAQTHPYHGFWGGIRRFYSTVYCGLRYYFVPRARAFFCMDQEDEYAVPPETAKKDAALAKVYPALLAEQFQINPSWAFTWARDDASDVQARVWQRGHARKTQPLSIGPDVGKDRYELSFDVRF